MPEIDFNIFRENLKKARNIKELSAKDLSNECGLRQQKRIADIEEGRGKPSIEEVYKICEVLGQSMEMMMKYSGRVHLDFSVSILTKA